MRRTKLSRKQAQILEDMQQTAENIDWDEFKRTYPKRVERKVAINEEIRRKSLGMAQLHVLD